jgi:hypothetical protein
VTDVEKQAREANAACRNDCSGREGDAEESELAGHEIAAPRAALSHEPDEEVLRSDFGAVRRGFVLRVTLSPQRRF